MQSPYCNSSTCLYIFIQQTTDSQTVQPDKRSALLSLSITSYYVVIHLKCSIFSLASWISIIYRFFRIQTANKATLTDSPSVPDILLSDRGLLYYWIFKGYNICN